MNRSVDYKMLAKQLQALCEGVDFAMANLANASALLNEYLDDINWVGFYLMREGDLWLGPFQGKVACTRIAVGRGVCGTAVAKDETILVEDVHAFPGHIACDAASRSEIVVPIHVNGQVYGVLDIDSPYESRFTMEDQSGLEQFVKILEKYLH